MSEKGLRFSATFPYMTGEESLKLSFPSKGGLSKDCCQKTKRWWWGGGGAGIRFKRENSVIIMLEGLHPWGSKQEQSWTATGKGLIILILRQLILLSSAVRNGDSTERHEFQLHAKGAGKVFTFQNLRLPIITYLHGSWWRGQRATSF